MSILGEPSFVLRGGWMNDNNLKLNLNDKVRIETRIRWPDALSLLSHWIASGIADNPSTSYSVSDVPPRRLTRILSEKIRGKFRREPALQTSCVRSPVSS